MAASANAASHAQCSGADGEGRPELAVRFEAEEPHLAAQPGQAVLPASKPAEGGEGLTASTLLVSLLSTCFAFLPPGVNASLMERLQKERARGGVACGAAGSVPDDHPVRQFLLEAHLPQYAALLVGSGFDDLETLLAIDDEDMKDLGLPRGHMVKLRKRLRETSTAKAPATIVRICSVGKPAGTSERMLSQPPTESMMSAVRQSWEKVQALGSEAVAEALYRALFDLAPDAVDLFPAQVRHKYRDWNAGETADESNVYESPALRNLFGKVLNAVGSAVAGFHDLNQLVPRLTQLGIRHAGYGVKERHFHILGKALIKTLQKTLGSECTPEVEFAWTMVYNFLSAVMAAGWREAQETARQAQEKAKVAARSVSAGPLSYTGGSGGGGSDLSSARSSARSRSKAGGSDNGGSEEGSREILGGREVYRIERHLQKAIFGDVYEATGMTSGRSFAIKVLDREVVQRFASVQQQDHQFCESPLSEVRYLEVMSGLDHVVQMEEHFGDEFYHFVVSELATGGDLLEALRLRPGGFKERQAQLLIREAAKGLMSLHQRGLAMQDVSLENMLLYVLDDGTWQVRICDPGQAAPFTVDPVTHLEGPVPFRGFVAKDFRPPELYAKREYLATKVDSWCLGWSAFYLLVARPMFLSADPLMNDPHWALFQRRSFNKLFQEKGWRATLSPQAKDFILRLMHINPRQRMSIKDALRHPWLADERIWRGCVPEPSRPLLPEGQGLGGHVRSRSLVSSTSLQRLQSAGGASADAGNDNAGMMIRVGCTHEFQLPPLSLLPGRDAALAPPAQSSWSLQHEAGCDGALDWPDAQPLEAKDNLCGWQPPKLEKKAQGHLAQPQGTPKGELGFPQLLSKGLATEEDASKELLRKAAGPTLLCPSHGVAGVKVAASGKEGKLQTTSPGFAHTTGGAGFAQTAHAGFGQA